MHFFRKTIRVAVEWNFLLAFGAVCLSLETWLLVGKIILWNCILPLLFFSTLFIYNLNKTDSGFQGKNPASKIFVLFSVSGIIASSPFVNPDALVFLIPFGLMALAYQLPFTGLRRIPYLKIFLISATWASVTVFLPAKEAGLDIVSKEILLLFSRRFFFIFAIAVPFDIRDAEKDRMQQVKTLPLLLGETKSKILALLSTAAFLLHNAGIVHAVSPGYLSGAIILCVFMGCLIIRCAPERSKYFFFALDGILVIQFIPGFLSLCF